MKHQVKNMKSHLHDGKTFLSVSRQSGSHSEQQCVGSGFPLDLRQSQSLEKSLKTRNECKNNYTQKNCNEAGGGGQQ